jgi:hypothetical protein
MGRIHRYGQRHDPVYIFNLVAGRTREGRVMRTLLEKLERIKAELSSDKVFDVLGELLEGISLQRYFTQLQASEEDEHAQERELVRTFDRVITAERIAQVQRQELLAADVRDSIRTSLPRLQEALSRETLRELLPGYMRGYLEHAVPYLHLRIEGTLDQTFTLQPTAPGALGWLYPALAGYSPEEQQALTVYPNIDEDQSIFLHPGEPVFERLRERVQLLCGPDARRGAVFVDPALERPYYYCLLEASVMRAAEPTLRPLRRAGLLERRLFALSLSMDGRAELCPIETLLQLPSLNALPEPYRPLAQQGQALREQALAFARQRLLEDEVERQRTRLARELAGREQALLLGFEYLEVDLLKRRARLEAKPGGTKEPHLRGELTRVETQYASLKQRKAEALAVLRCEPELVEGGDILFLAHALVVPAPVPEEFQRLQLDVEQRALEVALAFERQQAAVFDVSTPAAALAQGLNAWPGFDLLAVEADGTRRAIEVKGRVGTGAVELSANEYGKACTLQDRYWLYVVFDCEKEYPRLVRVQNPFEKLVSRPRGSVLIESRAILEAAAP